MTGCSPEELAAHFESQFDASAQDIDCMVGHVALSTTGGFSLDGFFKSQATHVGADEEDYDYSAFDDFLHYMTGGDLEQLVEWETNPCGPPSWFWHVGAFRIHDHGYIYLWHEPDVESGQPVLASWSPYDRQDVFEVAFVEIYRARFEYNETASLCTRGKRVSEELLDRALKAGNYI